MIKLSTNGDKMETIFSAEKYNAVSDLWIVTTYFNSGAYDAKYNNFHIFAEKLRRSNINLLIVECAYDDNPFVIPPDHNVLQIRAGSVMWQKERLLNYAISHLPEECKKVAWLDCDVLFENADWAVQASELLNHYPILQLYSDAIRLPRSNLYYAGEGLRYKSMSAICNTYPDELLMGNFDKHGHTGFAWAARRDFLSEFGLYDACISGSGDHIMAHAFYGDWDSICIGRLFNGNKKHHSHFADWSRKMYHEVRAKVGFVPGTVLHLWHGDKKNRRYLARNQELALFDFDPVQDIRIGENGAWEWSSGKKEMHRWAVNYFNLRKEDGDKALSKTNVDLSYNGKNASVDKQKYINALESSLGRAHLKLETLRSKQKS